MRKVKIILFFVASLYLFTACGEKSISDEKSSNMQTIEEAKNEVLESEQIANDENETYDESVKSNEDYEEYINSLRYLGEIEAKFHMANTTVDMLDAVRHTREAWDKELNRIYALLLEKLSMEQIEELRTIQRSWIKERDQLADQYANYEGGTLFPIDYNGILVHCTKQRTLELVSVYFNKRNDFSFNYAFFDVYDINKKYYDEYDSYIELDLELPKLEGNYDGIPAINEYFASKEQFFYEQLPLDILEQLDTPVTMEGKENGYFVSAYYYLETQIGDIISITAILDGGAGGVSWAAIEGNAFNLCTGKKIKLSDLFQVSEKEYMEFIYDYVSKEITKEIRTGNNEYIFQDAYSEEGVTGIRSFNQDNFIVSDSALILFYEKYELAYGASGVKKFEIPYELIKDILSVDVSIAGGYDVSLR